ncbi:MAG: PDZ domain-containing protein [Actinomycetes bacterium]
MPFPDEPDDDAGFISPLPQDDRLWRHPSEMAGPNAALPSVRRRRSPATGLLALLVIGAVAAVTATAAIGRIDPGRAADSDQFAAVGPAASALTASTLAALAPTLVQITIDGPTDSKVVTGLLIRSDGHIITAADPLEGARSLTVTTSDGTAFNAIVIGRDTTDDLAVIDIEAAGLPTPSFGDISSITQGETVYVVSRNGNDSRAWVAPARFQSAGMRLNAPDGTSMYDMIGSTLDTPPPTASAVLCTGRGEVIGILTSRTAATTRSLAFSAAPSTLALPTSHTAFAHSMTWTNHVADDLITSGVVHHTWLGVMSSDAPAGGASIESVIPDGPAARAGLLAGDRITSLGGRTISSSSDLLVALRHFSPEELVKITVVRGDRSTTATVTLSDRT